MKSVYITRNIDNIAYQKLSKYFHVSYNHYNTKLPEKKLIEVIKNHDAILSMPNDDLSEENLKNAQILKCISNYAAGLDNIDIHYTKRNNIAVFNVSDVVTNSTADIVFALILEHSRKISESFRFIKKNAWKSWDPYLFVGEDFESKNFGIIGFGRIGKAVAKRALAFGFKVFFYDKFESHSNNNDGLLNGCKRTDSEFILKNCDYISLHIPLTSETLDLINYDEFMLMKKKPIIINTSRGKVINSNALLFAIENGLISAALLDVFNPEPIDKKNPILKHKNVLITPHIGTATYQTRNKMASVAANNIIDFFNKQE